MYNVGTFKFKKFIFLTGTVMSEDDIKDAVYWIHLESDDFTRLYLELHLTNRKIEEAKRRANTHSLQLQAIYVLNDWRRDNGNRASRWALIEALYTCDFVDAKQILEKKWNIRFPGNFNQCEHIGCKLNCKKFKYTYNLHSIHNASATSHSDVQYGENLWTIRHYVMRLTNLCSMQYYVIILNYESKPCEVNEDIFFAKNL